jgi:hypothetical protein
VSDLGRARAQGRRILESQRDVTRQPGADRRARAANEYGRRDPAELGSEAGAGRGTGARRENPGLRQKIRESRLLSHELQLLELLAKVLTNSLFKATGLAAFEVPLELRSISVVEHTTRLSLEKRFGVEVREVHVHRYP